MPFVAAVSTIGRVSTPVASQRIGANHSKIFVHKSLERSLNILLVEDSVSLQEITVAMLEELGHRIVVASDAETGLAQLRELPIDLMITDVSLPGMSGIDLARTVSREWPKLPVIISSGFAELTGELLRRELRSPIEVLTKPYTLEGLSKAISDTTPSAEV